MTDTTAFALAEAVDVCRLLHARGYVAAYDGNVSVRIGDDAWITRSGVALREVTDADFVRFTWNGTSADGTPSSEWRMHAALYGASQQTRAVVHAHPPQATAFAVCGRALDDALLPDVVARHGAFPLVRYATPGTSEVGEGLVKAFQEGHHGYLLENHGVTAVGNDVWSAYYLLEKIEQTARITALAERAGTPQPIPHAERERLRTLYG